MGSLAGKRRRTYGIVSQKEISSSPFAYDAAYPNVGGNTFRLAILLQTDKFVLRELEPARVTVSPPSRVIIESGLSQYRELPSSPQPATAGGETVRVQELGCQLSG